MSSMEHQEVNLGQQQNQDLIWDLDSIARRELAERFIKLFENRLCVYSESTRQLYTNYNLHFPADYGRKMVVLPNPYAFHDTLHGIDPVAVRKTGLCVLPGVVLGKPGLLLTTQIRDGGPAPKTMPFKPALAQIISNQKKIGDVFLPILMIFGLCQRLHLRFMLHKATMAVMTASTQVQWHLLMMLPRHGFHTRAV